MFEPHYHWTFIQRYSSVWNSHSLVNKHFTFPAYNDCEYYNCEVKISFQANNFNVLSKVSKWRNIFPISAQTTLLYDISIFRETTDKYFDNSLNISKEKNPCLRWYLIQRVSTWPSSMRGYFEVSKAYHYKRRLKRVWLYDFGPTLVPVMTAML